jgi:hypothetical protein
MWIGPRLLLAGAADVIDLDARAVTATIGLLMKRPLASPDGRFWAAQSDGRGGKEGQPPISLEAVAAIKLDAAINSLPKVAFDDIVFREGVAVDTVSSTGSAARDAVVRSILKQHLAGEGYGTEGGQWRLEVTAERVASGGTLETPSGGRIQIPSVNGRIRLLDPGGAEIWKGPLGGFWDANHSKYKTSKEDLGPGPGGGSITHYNFGLRDPGDAMAEEAWDNFMGSVKGTPRFPRVLARINGKLERLPVAVPAAGK